MNVPSEHGETAASMDVSVIVVNWNTRELLRHCLDSVREASVALKIETIVIDNASHDGSAESVRRHFPEVTLIENGENLGFSAANNQGLARAGGRYVLLLNSDAVLKPGALEEVVAWAEANPQAGMVGCRVLNTDGSLQVSCMRFPDFQGLLTSALFLPRLLPKWGFLGYEDLTWWDHRDEREVDVLKGCFILARSAAIRQIGMLDESFWLYGEETDWCQRMKQAGWSIHFTPRAEIIHHGGASTNQLSGWILHQLWGAKLQFTGKHRSPTHHALCSAAIALWFAIRIVPFTAAALLSRERRKTSWNRARACASGVCKLIFLGPDSLIRKPIPRV